MWGVWVLLALLAFAGLGRGLWTPDEPREAEISREMALHPGVIPTLGGHPFYEKPPLYYWVTAAVFTVAGGPSAAAARAVSGAAGLLTLLVLFLWVKREVSVGAALLAVVLLATSVQFFLSTHWVLLDPLLMLFSTLAAWAGWELVGRRGGGGFLALFYGALGLAFWTKGPIGPALLVAGLGAYALLERRNRPWKALHPFAGAAFLLAVLLSIAGAIYLDGGSEALWAWGWVNHVQRFLEPQGTGHNEPIYYYARSLPVAVLPWLVPFLDLFRRSFWRRPAEDLPLRRYCGALAVGGLAVLTLSATKRETYLLPLLPPLLLLMALAVRDRFLEARPAGGWRRAGEWLQAALSALLVLVPSLAVVAYTRSVGPGSGAALAAAAILAGGLFAAVYRHRLRLAAGFAAAAAVVSLGTALALVVPRLEPEKDFRPFLERVDRTLPAGEPVYAVGADETVLGIVPFVTRRRVVQMAPQALPDGSPGAPPPLYVLAQQKGRKAPRLPELEAHYELVDPWGGSRDRRLGLWRRKPAADPEPSSPEPRP